MPNIAVCCTGLLHRKNEWRPGGLIIELTLHNSVSWHESHGAGIVLLNVFSAVFNVHFGTDTFLAFLAMSCIRVQTHMLAYQIMTGWPGWLGSDRLDRRASPDGWLSGWYRRDRYCSPIRSRWAAGAQGKQC